MIFISIYVFFHFQRADKKIPTEMSWYPLNSFYSCFSLLVCIHLERDTFTAR